MKLNPDCVRDILLEIENRSVFGSFVILSKRNEIKIHSKYQWEEIIYHIRQCEMHDFITPVNYADVDEVAIVSDLTPDGHEFLANIRSDNNWNKVKEIAKKVGSVSFEALTTIASNVISDVISSKMGL